MNTPAYSQPSFKGLIGVAQADITPPVAIYSRNWGAAQHDVADGIHRPFTATVLTMQAIPDVAPLVLIAVDLGWWRTAGDEWFLRGWLLEKLGLDAANVMINLSHTHAGPSLCRADIDKEGGEFITPYLERLRHTLVRITEEALSARQPAALTWRYGWCGLAQNRDLPDPERERIVCGFNPQGPADGTLLVGRVSSVGGATLATLVNYACHPTTLAWDNHRLSPDYIGAMREVVEGHNGTPCLFLQGASGELAPSEQYTGDTEVPDRHGRELGHAVIATLEGMTPPNSDLYYAGVMESGAPLAVWKTSVAAPSSFVHARLVDVELPLKEMPSADEIERDLQSCTDRVLAERLRRKWHIRKTVGDGETTPIPLWVWRTGDTLFIGQQNEAYSDLQRSLRASFPYLAVVVMNLVNGSMGYLPPQELYSEDVYPVWQTPFERGSLEKVITAAQETAGEL